MPGWVGSLMNTLEAFLLLGAPMLKIFLSRGKPQAQLSGWGGFAKPPSKTLHMAAWSAGPALGVGHKRGAVLRLGRWQWGWMRLVVARHTSPKRGRK